MPMRVLCIDVLHTLYLGPMQRWCWNVLWRLMRAGIWGAFEATEEERMKVCILAVHAALRRWYKQMYRQSKRTTLTRISGLTLKMVGTPDKCKILASSEGHDSDYVLVPEEHLTHLTTVPGEPLKSLLRADMVYFENSNGGKVFSTGSITFCGSLPYNNFKNNISTLLGNILNNFSK